MFKIRRKSVDWDGRTLSLETGKIARQADGSVVLNYRDTSIFFTVVRKKKEESVDFHPLNVQLQKVMPWVRYLMVFLKEMENHLIEKL